MFKGSIRILDSNEKISANILAASESELKNIFAKAKVKIQSQVTNLVVEALSSCPEILSLQSGKLKYDFGLDFDPTQEIIYGIANSTYVYFKNFKLLKTKATSVLSIYVQPEDFRNILGSSSAIVTTDNGTILPWLQWLLLEGDAIIITQYHVDYGSYPNSRSGGAIMKPSGIFKVDSQFSGTVDDNFITRALEKYQEKIVDIIRTSI